MNTEGETERPAMRLEGGAGAVEGPQGWLTKAAVRREQFKQRGARWMTVVEGNSGSSWRKD